MILFRVLNEYDMIVNPVENGIASKKFIFELAKEYNKKNNEIEIEKMSELEKNEYMKNYLIENKSKISKYFDKKHLPIRNNIHRFVESKDDFAYCEMLRNLSTLPNHLINGSRTITNWISTTSSFDGIWKYYDSQYCHSVVIIKVSTNGVFDRNTYVVDVSNRDTIEKIKFISNKINKDDYDMLIKYIRENSEYKDYLVSSFHDLIMKPTSKKFMGYNFSSSSSEYDIYEYISKDNIISLLGQLEIDLIRSDLFNIGYLQMSHKKQREELQKLKYMMKKHILYENDFYMLYVFKELYLENHNINSIVSNTLEKEKTELMRNNILSKSQYLPSCLIKKNII